MKHLTTYKLFESNRYGYESTRSRYPGLEKEFKIYDKIISELNDNYDNVKIEHRGNKFYDIFYKLTEPTVLNPIDTGNEPELINNPTQWIAIGVFDCEKLEFTLFRAENSITEYSSRGFNGDDYITWNSGLNEFSFDIFLNKWYDIYDNL
jgi:hypothetical protein